MNLATRYLGLDLKNPLVASASPLSRTLHGIRNLEEAGAGAVVLYSLFEEQIVWSDRRQAADAPPPHCTPDWDAEPVGPDEYLDLVSLAKRTVAIPVIGSLNGSASGDWTRYAHLIEEAGADALELNLNYISTDADTSGATVEQHYLNAVREVRRSTTIPLAVKIGPCFSALPAMAQQIVEAGADGLVLFNRFYGTEFDIETRTVSMGRIAPSGAEDILLPLHWVALLYGKVKSDLALTGGVHTHEDVLKSVMAGANVAMMASELLQNGVDRIDEILGDLGRWLETHGFDSVDPIRGILSAGYQATEPTATERTRYINTVRSLRPEGDSARHLYL